MEDVFALLRKRREQEALHQVSNTSEIFARATERRKKSVYERKKKWVQDHPEKIKEIRAKHSAKPETKAKLHEYYEKNKEHILEKNKRNRLARIAADPEREKRINTERKRREYLANPEKFKERQRVYYAKLPEEKKEAKRQRNRDWWASLSPEEKLEYYRKKRERKRQREAERRERAIEDNGCGIENVIVNPAGEHRATEKIAG